MGISKKGYYTTADIAKMDALYNIILSGRNAGKSYAIATDHDRSNKWHVGYLWRAWESKSMVCGYVRRHLEDVHAADVAQDYADKPISKITDGEYNTVDVWRGKIYFAKLNDDGTIKRAPFAFAQIFALSRWERYKSRQYPTITDLIYEEFVTKGLYLRDEPTILQHLVSTIFRDRPGRVWLIANTISRVCPYFQEWSLTGVPLMKEGQIDVYEMQGVNGSITKLAVEMSPNRGEVNSSMFFGTAAKSIVGSAWETKEYLKLEGELKDYDELSLITFKYNGFSFNCRLLMDEDANIFCYINPARRDADLIITDEPSIKSNVQPALDRNRKIHMLYIDALRKKKVSFSTNLTGEDFWACYRNATVRPF